MRRKKPERKLERQVFKKGEIILGKLQELGRNRMFLIVAGVIFAIALVGGISSILILRSKAPSDIMGKIEGDPELVEVLPQQTRSDEDLDEEGWASFSPFSDPFSDPIKLTGVIFGGRGGSMAIVRSSGRSYIVAEGDYIDDYWAVRRIEQDVVILRAHDQEVSLFFDQAPETRTINLWENEMDDLEEGS